MWELHRKQLPNFISAWERVEGGKGRNRHASNKNSICVEEFPEDEQVNHLWLTWNGLDVSGEKIWILQLKELTFKHQRNTKGRYNCKCLQCYKETCSTTPSPRGQWHLPSHKHLANKWAWITFSSPESITWNRTLMTFFVFFNQSGITMCCHN